MSLYLPSLEPGTFRVLGGCDNHYTIGTTIGIEFSCQICFLADKHHVTASKFQFVISVYQHKFYYQDSYKQAPNSYITICLLREEDEGRGAEQQGDGQHRPGEGPPRQHQQASGK
ncbi:hypothetical protein CEXT_6301 [Caerostris extrusa]|uniref:Uncharacterized protein n=1 Tax=Caerostris extrusa TaxID=172846 RepID=A0AAV4PLF0_CAEEX|nr:hypothetical protein CEXT_6301 [Caerostris extrusa]